MCFKSCDLAIPGSPMRATLIYPLIFKLSWVSLVTPPAISSSRACFTFSIPKISGAMEEARRLKRLESSRLARTP